MIFVKSFEWYEPAVGDNSEYTRRASGAYIFRPNGTKTILVGDPTSATLLKGRMKNINHLSSVFPSDYNFHWED